ncbi:G-protein coupled receptor 52-like [Asterias amurensis]|uniref:G-protein coupled receptor 52-like n=1 Tax=Asterias amurensis TaxID=7602 RepID=UPI003AB133B1
MEYSNDYTGDNNTYMYTDSSNENLTEADSFTTLPTFSRVILILTIVLIIASNAIVLVVLPRMKNCLTKMKLFLQSLAMADMSVGFMWFIIHIDNIFAYKVVLLRYWQCLLIIHLLLVVLTVSVLTLSMISVERYIAVVKPFKYHTLINPWRAKCAVGSIWCLSLMLYLPVYTVLLFIVEQTSEPLCETNFMTVIHTCFYLLSVIIVPNVFLSLYCYTSIIKKIMGQAKFSNKHGSLRRRRSGRRTESKLAKISISLYSGFYISWLPFVVISVIAFISITDVNEIVYHTTLNIGLWNSILNCLIYSISHKPFRAELKRLLLPAPSNTCCNSCCCCRSQTKTELSITATQPWQTSQAMNLRKHSKSRLTPIPDNLPIERGYFNNEGIVLEISQNI